LTRLQLETTSDRLARDLIARGVERGDMVTIALPNSVDWFVAQHALWRIGAIPQPVSARLPSRELDGIVELADSRLVLGVSAGFDCWPFVVAGWVRTHRGITLRSTCRTSTM